MLVDDHALFRDGLRGLLCRGGLCEVVAEAADGRQFVEMMRGGLVADVVLLDIDMPGMGGFEVAEKMASEYPGARIITLSMHCDEEYYFRMVALGVKGFLLKNSSIDEVTAAIKAVASGNTYFSQELLTMLVAGMGMQHGGDENPAEILSDRELEILELICKGMSNHEIGDRLFISKRTVDKHRANILEKTGARNTANLVMFAIKHSLVSIK